MMDDNQPAFYQLSEDAMRKMFAEVKSNDLSRAEFERNKTERIKALADAIGRCDGYGLSGYAHKIYNRLEEVCQSKYESTPILHR